LILLTPAGSYPGPTAGFFYRSGGALFGKTGTIRPRRRDVQSTKAKQVESGSADMSVASIVRLVGACAVSLSAGLIGAIVGAEGGFTSWYSTILKPSFTPPSWVFGPVWTILYILMGIAAFLVWQKGLGHRAVRIALIWFLVQLALNALWSPVFFGLHRIGLALLVIVLLWVAIAVTMHRFFRISRPAGWLLMPYLLWVSFAVSLNTSFWSLNR
jgi:benzodiazapine receptor